MNACGKSTRFVLRFSRVVSLFLMLLIGLGPITSTRAGHPGQALPDIQNLPPTAGDDSGGGFTTREDQVLFTDNVLLNDTDPDGDALFISSLDASTAKGLVSQVSGRLNASFGEEGKVITKIEGTSQESTDLILQPDGKMIMIGRVNNYDTGYDFVLFRYNTDGSLDQSFDGDGIVITDFNWTNRAYAGALQLDNKIIVVGVSDEFDLLLARYNPDGSLDPAFDEDGKLTITGLNVHNSYSMGIAIQADGKIVVVANCMVSCPGLDTRESILIARFTPDGMLDTSFDEDGFVTVDVFVNSSGYDLVIQPDNKILVSGLGLDSNGYFVEVVARFNIDGSMDTSFDGDGYVSTNVGHDIYGRLGIAIALQRDNKIVVASNVSEYFYLVRYNPDGGVDTSFDNDGIVTSNLIQVKEIAIQPSGKIVAIGTHNFWDGTIREMSVIRFNPDGSIDTTFGDAGAVKFGIKGSQGSAIALGSYGQINVAGFVYDYPGYNFIAAQMWGDGIFSYDPNHQFDDLPAGTRAYDTFTYTANDGMVTDTASVTVTITGKGYVYLPVVNYRPGIYGTVTENGLTVSGVTLELRFYNGSSWSTVASTTSNSIGNYNFYGIPGLVPGQAYYVRYNNPGNRERLWVWATRVLTDYTNSTPVNIGDFDVADIKLAYLSNKFVSLPFTFHWYPRSASLTDNYEFNLFDPIDGDPYFFTDPPLGYVDSYTLQSLPTGFRSGYEYVWEIWVYSPDGGYGISYFYDNVYFSNLNLGNPTDMLPIHPKTVPEPMVRVLR